MAGASRNDRYIKCARCKTQYINDDDHIQIDFGYNRLEERYKVCVKCRNKDKRWIDNLKKVADDNHDTIKHGYRCYKNKPLADFVCPNGKSYNACYDCLKKRYG